MSESLDAFIEKADMPQNGDPVTSCDICGEDLFNGDRGVGVTTGRFETWAAGFVANEDEWLNIVCVECGKKIGDAIEKLMDKEER